MKCINCEKCKIIVNQLGTYAEARCEFKIQPKKGKVLASAFTTYKGFSIIKDIKEYCKDRVMKKLELCEPKWCPLNK